MRRLRPLVAFAGLFAAGLLPFANSSPVTARAAPSSPHMAKNCEYALCAEVANPADVFDRYVGHDEPSNVFYSSVPGSGNRMGYDITLPTDPSPTNPTQRGKSFTFELNGAQWFGLAMCDTQSYPEQVSTCPPDSDGNIANNPDPTAPDYIGHHSGTAFMELQFYPPGWVPWPTWAVAVGASACDPTRWCAAMNIFSLSIDPINGTTLNDTCASVVGLEYVNFAFITRNGVAQAPANPVDSTLATFTPDPNKDLFMNSGDKLRVTLNDTAHGLMAVIHDKTTGQSGSMTASAANGFGQVQFAPNPSTACVNIPYDFHPMYSTSSEATRVIWAAHTYNVVFSDEIGHFENCSGQVPATPFGIDSSGHIVSCPTGSTEGARGNVEPTDPDDNWCFPASEALVIHVTGCTDTNSGFDGLDYTPVWPDGNTRLHPTPVLFSSPLTGEDFSVNYERAAFEADLPRIEFGRCNRVTGAGCTLTPIDDEGNPVAFYPTYSSVSANGGCVWGYGGTLPNTINNFGGQAEWGTMLQTVYLRFGGGGATRLLFNNFRQIFSTNPCPAPANGD